MVNPKNKSFIHSFLLQTVVCLAVKVLCQEKDTITSNSSIKDPNTIVSESKIFKLGFFSPENSTNRYLGIFYAFSEDNVVWVANRNKPITDSSGSVIISNDGNLVLLNGQNETIWSTNATSTPLNTKAKILDTGNLVLHDVSSGGVIWESFMHPTHVFLPTMKNIDDGGTSKKESSWSWKNNSDPAVGSFSNGMEFRKIPEIFTWNNGRPHWRSGPWNGRTLLGVLADLNTLSRNGFRVENDSSGTMYSTMLPDRDALMKATLDPLGRLLMTFWNNDSKTWLQVGVLPEHECDLYGTCGPFGICNRQNSPICSCFRGFEPSDKEEWERGNWSGGCVRRKQLQCSGQGNNTDSTVNVNDGFFTMQFMKLPDFPEQFTPRQEDECRTRCLRNCSCIAHAYDSNIGCMFWSGTLIDVQQFPGLGPDLHIRLTSSELDNKKNLKTMIIVLVVVVLIFIPICMFIAWRWMLKPQGEKGKDRDVLQGAQTHSSDDNAIILIHESNTYPIEGLPSFTIKMLANATNEFHHDNLLGKGGFGPVYKGNLANGNTIAVKRLSTACGQGTKEFMNEVMVISKLQHMNLTRLIGCCMESDERILVYEYMPNRSLDACLFDLSKPPPSILHWRKRLSIIEGVGRGLLYLHRDSRLKIIHRDLKPSNVLLDKDWNPKISDFGMARIFGGDQDHGNTLHVAGTHGYMAPEYAMEGRFSEKSDVYSFGVLMLEIISGTKNTQYYNEELSLSLLGYAWKLWTEKNGLAFLDQKLTTSSESKEEIIRCIHIALLCVQEYSEDRPDIHTVLLMLNKEIKDLTIPKKPEFAEKWKRFHDRSTRSVAEIDQPSTMSL